MSSFNSPAVSPAPPAQATPLPSVEHRPRSMWRMPIALWLVSAIAILTGAMRLGLIAEGLSATTLPDDYEGAHYLDHLLPIVSHIVLGSAFLVLGPLQLSPRFRRRWPAWHRWAGRVFVLTTLVAGLTGLWMNEFFPPIGGPIKYISTHLFGVAMLLALGLAMRSILSGDVAGHRRWMIRAYAIGLGPATQRLLILPLFVAFGPLSDLAIGLGMTAGWVLNVLVGERVVRQRP